MQIRPPRLVDKCKRRHRRNPALPTFIPGGGKVVSVGGALCVALPLIDGTVAHYPVSSTTTWRFSKPVLTSPAAPPTPSPGERIKRALDEALELIADAEERGFRLPTAAE
jgi:hypothetical protein